MKRNIKSIFALSLLSLSLFGTGAIQNANALEPIYNNVNTSQEDNMLPVKDILELRYKVVNGKCYYRWYNTTTCEWVGEWKLLE